MKGIGRWLRTRKVYWDFERGWKMWVLKLSPFFDVVY